MHNVDMVQAYKKAAASYTPKDCETFLDLARIHDPKFRDLCGEFLNIAGCIYFAELEHQAIAPERSELAGHLARAQAASRDLATHLEVVFSDHDFLKRFLAEAMTQEDASKTGRLADSGGSQILASIFPYEIALRGFRVDGLLESLRFIAERLAEHGAEDFQRRPRGRRAATNHWLQAISMFWVFAKDELPAPGKYDREVADYSSLDIAALTFAAQKLDPEISSRLVVSALAEAKKDLSAKHDQAPLRLKDAIFAAKHVEGDSKALIFLLELISAPEDVVQQFLAATSPEVWQGPVPDGPRILVPDDVFEETLKIINYEFELFPKFVEENNG